MGLSKKKSVDRLRALGNTEKRPVTWERAPLGLMVYIIIYVNIARRIVQTLSSAHYTNVYVQSL